MSERGRGREREKTSLGFNDISNIHADAFCCFVLSFSAALPARVSSSTHTPQPGTEEGSKGERGKRQVGEKGGINNWPNKQASKHKSLFVCNVRSNLPCPGLVKKTRRGSKAKQQIRESRKKRRHERNKAQKGIDRERTRKAGGKKNQ